MSKVIDELELGWGRRGTAVRGKNGLTAVLKSDTMTAVSAWCGLCDLKPSRLCFHR